MPEHVETKSLKRTASFSSEEEDHKKGRQGEVDVLLVRQQTRKDIDPEKLKGDPFKGSYLVLFLERTTVDRTFRRVGMGQLFLCEDIKELDKSQIFII